MSDLEVVHPVPVEQCRDWLATLRTTFLQDPDPDALGPAVARLGPEWDPDRHWGARADGRWVATLAALSRTVTVPGPAGATRDVTVDALSAVTVNPAYRRRGLLRQMLRASLDAAKDRGDALSVLVAAEWTIYGRFGYAPATREGWYTYSPRGAAVTPAPDGAVRQVELDELASLAPDVFDTARRSHAGQIDRPGDWWARLAGSAGYPAPDPPLGTWVLHESADGPDGLLRWVPVSPFSLDGTLASVDVLDLIAASPTAYRNLWAYLGGLDLVGEITMVRRPVDEPVRWLLADGRALRQTHTGDGMWLRLLDVPAALAARSYSAQGRLVLDVVDEHGGYASGRYLLDTSSDATSCTPTPAAADLRLSQRALAAAYLGGYSFRQLVITGGVEEVVSGALARADMMFATGLPPWNQTMF